DDEAPREMLALAADLAADAAPAHARGRERRRRRHLRAPVEPVRIERFAARRDGARGIPRRDDVVDALVRDRNLEQIDRALIESRERLDPDARPPVVPDAVVLVMIEVTVAL